MSKNSDLLRRAAAELRKCAEAATPGPWMSATNTGRKDGISLVGATANRGTGRAVAVLADTDVHQRAADARLIELMHPPVVLAIAQLLQTISWCPSVGNPTDLIAAERLAREVLRESEAGAP